MAVTSTTSVNYATLPLLLLRLHVACSRPRYFPIPTRNNIPLIPLLGLRQYRCYSSFLSRGGFSRVKFASAATSMPPKRAASSSKRKAEEVSSSPEDISDTERTSHKQPAKKKAKKQKPKDEGEEGEEGLASNGQPTNKVLPTHIEFEPKSPGSLRIAAWNICGLAASQKKVRTRRSFLN